MTEQRPMPVNRTEGPTGPRRRISVADTTLAPKEVFSILRRHTLLIIVLTILGLITAGGAWYLLLKYRPKYTAETYIKVLPPVERDPMKIGAVTVNQDIQYGYRLSMANLIKQQNTLAELLDSTKVRQTKWFKRFAEFNDRGEIINVQQCIINAFRDLRKHFGAYAHREAEFVVLSMTCGNPQEAADIVNEMVRLFVASQGGTTKAEVGVRLIELEKRRTAVEGELNIAEQGLTAIRDRFELTDIERQPGRYFRHTIELRLDDLELEQNDLTLLIKQAQADIKNLERLATEPFNEQVERQVEVDPVMVTLAQQLALLESQLSGQLSRFGENHRIVRQTQELINQIRQERQIRQKEIGEQIRQANLKNAQDRLLVWQSRYEELERMRLEAVTEKEQLDLARVLYEQQLARRDERQKMLETIKAQIESWRMLRDDPEATKVQAVGIAPPPLEVSSPRWEFYFPAGSILGLMAGIGLALLIEMLNDLVRTPRDVARFLQIRLLTVIPDAAEDVQVRGIDLCHVVRQAPYSIISESYRRCRTNLKLSRTTQPPRVLLVTCGMAGDGVTSVAVNLAATFIAENRKTLLIDANFRRPSLHTIFPKPGAEKLEQSKLGLSNLLMGQCTYQQAIRPSGIGDLDIIDSGPLPSNPAELLSSKRMEQLMAEQRKNYDYIIIDGPPVLLVSEAKVLAKLVDGSVLVFNVHTTRRGAAQRTIRELKAVDAEILGCVLLAAMALKGGYFQEQFKSYQKYQKLQLARSV